MTPDPIIRVLTDAVRVRELIHVLRAFEHAGAVPVVFKGAALAHTHYAESWQRPRYDSDVLIASQSRERVFALLAAHGYERRTFMSGDLVTYQVPFGRVDHLGIEHPLDIHWRIANPQVVSQVLTHDELVERSVTVSVQGHPMRVPSAVDSLLVACVHRVAHHPDVEKPIWVRDIHVLATSLDTSEWTTFVERATNRSVCAISLQGLQRAQERFQTTIPVEVLRRLAASREERSAVFLRPGLRPVDRLTTDLRVLGPRAGVDLMREHLFPPPEYMYKTYGVRRRVLLPAYYAMRLLSGMSKWFRPYVSAAR